MEITFAEMFYFRVEEETSLKELCAKLKVNENEIIRNNFALPLYVGEVVLVNKLHNVNNINNIGNLNNEIYKVKPLDTLQGISLRFGVPEEEIIKLNNLESRKLFIGQQLILNSKKATD